MIASIFAVDASGGLGKNGTLPWPNDREDLEWFKFKTRGHIVVMGRKTWEDPKMPKPLPHRINCVVSSNRNFYKAENANVITEADGIKNTLNSLVQEFPSRTAWIIGGAQLLTTTADLIEQVYLTRFDNDYACDVKLNIEQYLANFNLVKEIPGNGKRFQIYHAKLPKSS